ncbi:MAG TPA: hypothetical protein VJ303_16770, partial [Steroidobacteraceae bacterium]|nr:hypothetical protein [Steroidobacteraceae bacterium]
MHSWRRASICDIGFAAATRVGELVWTGFSAAFAATWFVEEPALSLPVSAAAPFDDESPPDGGSFGGGVSDCAASGGIESAGLGPVAAVVTAGCFGI